MMFGCATTTDEALETGGTGGGGAGGTAGVGGVDLSCAVPTGRCTSGELDPVTKGDCAVDEPPVLPEACDGTESLERPTQCPLTGTTITYQLTSIALDGDCNSGYDLDGCDGDSCLRGDNASLEGADGVDNGLAGLASFVEGLGANLGIMNQAYYDALCSGLSDTRFIVDANPEDNCATVTPVIDAEEKGAVAVNLSDAGCLSGDVGNLPFFLGGTVRSLGNVRARFTVSDNGFANGKIGGTIDRNTATSIANMVIGSGAGLLVSRVLDINQELERDPLAACDALSLTLAVGGVTLESDP